MEHHRFAGASTAVANDRGLREAELSNGQPIEPRPPGKGPPRAPASTVAVGAVEGRLSEVGAGRSSRPQRSSGVREVPQRVQRHRTLGTRSERRGGTSWFSFAPRRRGDGRRAERDQGSGVFPGLVAHVQESGGSLRDSTSEIFDKHAELLVENCRSQCSTDRFRNLSSRTLGDELQRQYPVECFDVLGNEDLRRIVVHDRARNSGGHLPLSAIEISSGPESRQRFCCTTTVAILLESRPALVRQHFDRIEECVRSSRPQCYVALARPPREVGREEDEWDALRHLIS